MFSMVKTQIGKHIVVFHGLNNVLLLTVGGHIVFVGGHLFMESIISNPKWNPKTCFSNGKRTQFEKHIMVI